MRLTGLVLGGCLRKVVKRSIAAGFDDRRAEETAQAVDAAVSI